ncbi:MAG: hypothetical protein AAF609_24230 [Cyanobacteria bacterium P01_C01_bin.120]
MIYPGQTHLSIALAEICILTSTSCTNTPPAHIPTASISDSTPSTPLAKPTAQTKEDKPLYTVTRIYDGDTFDTFQDGQTIKVRLACIDAPEADQPPCG